MAINIDETPIISLEEFKTYYKSELDEKEELEVERLILVAQDKLIAENNTERNLLEELEAGNIISDIEMSYLTKALRHLVRYYFEEGVDKQASSVSVNVGSKNISRSQDGTNFLPETFYDLYGKTPFYSNEEFGEFFLDDPIAVETVQKSSKTINDKEAEPEKGINPDLIKAEEAWDKSNSNEGRLDIVEPKVEDNTQEIGVVDAKVNALIGQFKPSRQITGTGAGGTLIEGQWNIITYTNIADDFPEIGMTAAGTIMVSEEIENLRYFITGTADNSGTNKEIIFRLWDITNGAQVGNTRTELISDQNIISFSDVLTSLPAAEYRIEVFATPGGGDITFNNYLVDIFTLGTGTGASKSSELVNDKDTEPEAGINPDLIKIDEKANILEVVELQSGFVRISKDALDPTKFTLSEKFTNFNMIEIKAVSTAIYNSYSTMWILSDSVDTNVYYTMLLAEGNTGETDKTIVYYSFTSAQTVEVWSPSTGKADHVSIKGFSRKETPTRGNK